MFAELGPPPRGNLGHRKTAGVSCRPGGSVMGPSAIIRATSLFPLAVENKTGPVKRSGPARVATDMVLRGSKRRGWIESIPEDTLVEQLHKLRRGFVIDLPERGHYAGCARVKERAGQADRTFAFEFLSGCRFACAESHHVGGEIETIDVEQGEIAIPRLAVSVHQRKNQSGKLWPLVEAG